jgi:hypothetical protein
MKNAKPLRLSILAVPLLAACAPGMLQMQNDRLPALYQPGAGWDAPADEDAADAVDAGGRLAPQELPGEKPEFWLGDSAPTAGPAPRNTVSGGVLDVGVVPPAPHGKTAVAAPTHGLEPTESGRLYILELYQDVLEERDALALEVSGLVAELERSQAEVASLHGATSAEQSTVESLRQELALLRAESLDLAARLTTAQVRRLEAEKLLLETRIEMQRAALEEDAPSAGGVAMKDERP